MPHFKTLQPSEILIPKTNKIGFNLVSWDLTGTVNSNTWEKSIKELFHAGIRSVTIVPYQFVNKETGGISSTSFYGLAAPPSSEEIMAAIKEAKKLGMHVSLNPFIEIDDPGGIGSEWRGHLNYSHEKLEFFFKNYENYISNLSKLAEAMTIDRLYIGSELKSLTNNPEAQKFWYQVIFKTRQMFPKGILSYAANHDEYENVPFWDQLDEISADIYFQHPIDQKDNGLPVIKTKWKEWFHTLKKMSNKYNKPVHISEWGFQLHDFTGQDSLHWIPLEITESDEQIIAFKTTIDAVLSEGNWLTGLDFWHWGMPGAFESTYSLIPDSSLGQFISRYLMTVNHEKPHAAPEENFY